MSDLPLKASRQPAKGPVYPDYDGTPGELFSIYLQNVVLTLVTVGVYRFWATVRSRKYRYQHTLLPAGGVEGGRLDYHATGEEKFKGFLKGVVLLLPALVLLVMLDWQVTDGDPAAGFGSIVIAGVFLIGIALRPLVLVGSQRFNLAHTSWNHLRMRFTATISEAYSMYLRDYLFIGLTLGIYLSWHRCNVQKLRMRHTKLGETSFDFRGDGGQLFGINLFGTVFSYLTLGIYLPWFLAARQRFFIENMRLDGRRWTCRLKGLDVLRVGGLGLLVSVVTLGFGLPWAVTEWRRLMVETVRWEGDLDASELVSIQDLASSGTLEGLGEAGEALSELGNLFG